MSTAAPRPDEEEPPLTDPFDDSELDQGVEQEGESEAGARPEGDTERVLAPGDPTDHDLIRSAQRGEELGFQALVRRHEGRAMRVALGLVSNREDARDLAQEAFLRVFRNLERFDFQHEFTTWLYRIVTNLAIDHLRKRRPQHRDRKSVV
jgi:hypothetical protein